MRLVSLFMPLMHGGAALFLDARLVLAHEGEHVEQGFTDKDQHKPTPLPDRVVLTWSGDPTTSIDVT